ncbi:RNA-directed DNA polymerase from transposon X-element [Paramuricea clavata]|uniref:RNA-directed DNA polymerase from transposon X-element n=1 Tax=Paramuricea clavata TaxID=317549 RepID=A0A6S7FLC9_PARCT|nr:RNA-directed DNA polymerase from transposon X-element [Paramuricea clavata]
MDTIPEEANFRDHLLDEDHGLCVYIATICKTRFVILQNEITDTGQFFLELEHIQDEAERDVSVRYFLDEKSLSKIISSMDTEYDRMALKEVIFAVHSRTETYNLGIKPDRAVTFLSKVLFACEESEKTLQEAADVLQVRTCDRIKKLENKVQSIDQKIEKQEHFLSEKRRTDLEGEKDALNERLDNLKTLRMNDERAGRRVKQARKRIANQLLNSRGIKRRKLGAGLPSLLDEEDEEFIAKAIESKSTCHGRRHETTLFTHHRVKKRHFLSLAHHSLLKRGKKLITSATTVTNRGKPRNIKSVAAKAHHGKDTKAGVVYDVADPNKRRKLPQHDFNQPQVNQTPVSFRFIKGHVEEIEGKNNLINDKDQTVVIIRPKYYIGRSGSVWASDYLTLCHKHPSLFQESGLNPCSNELNKYVCHIHDIMFYFVDLTMMEDVQNATTKPHCQHRQYEEEKLHWLVQQSQDAVLEKEGILLDSEREIANELENDIHGIQDKAQFCKQNCCELIRKKELWEKLFRETLPPMCCDVLKATDAGPGVGVSNIEVRFRDVETARMHSSDRVNRIHRAPGDSGQNKAERSNAAIGDALVDGGSLKWQYYGPFDGLAEDEIDKLSISEVKKREEECMEKNAWRVSDEIKQVIDDEPGPAGDFMKCSVTTSKEMQFLFHSAYLMKYSTAKSEVRRKSIPGNTYFSKINAFMVAHCDIGEMYFEYLKGSCEAKSGKRCNYCISHDFCCSSITRAARPYPNLKISGFHYLAAKDAPTAERSVDDYHPRVQLKKTFAQNKDYFDEPNHIEQFSKKFVVAEAAVRKYVDHMKLLELKH